MSPLYAAFVASPHRCDGIRAQSEMIPGQVGASCSQPARTTSNAAANGDRLTGRHDHCAGFTSTAGRSHALRSAAAV